MIYLQIVRFVTFLLLFITTGLMFVGFYRPQTIQYFEFDDKMALFTIVSLITSMSLFLIVDCTIMLYKAHSREMKLYFMNNRKYSILAFIGSLILITIIEMIY